MSFKQIGNSILDEATGILWDIEYKTGLSHEEAFDYAKSQGKRLPTKKEFEEAEKNGIRKVEELDWEYKWFWSSTPHRDSDFAYGFDGNDGIVYDGVRGSRVDGDAVRLVSA